MLFLLVLSPLLQFFGALPAGHEELRGAIAFAIADSRDLFEVPPALVWAVIRVESNFDARAVSNAGAVGLMQVMPSNARRVGLEPKDLRDPRRNILAGVRLLAVLLRHYEGHLESALVAYNARPRPRGAPLPRNGETPAYVASVLRHFCAYAGLGRPKVPRPTLAEPSAEQAMASAYCLPLAGLSATAAVATDAQHGGGSLPRGGAR